MTEPSNEVVVRLDRIIAILQLAFRAQIVEARKQIRSGPVNAAILNESAEDWVRSGELQRRVATQTRASTRTVQSRLQELVASQAIERRGGAATTEYRSTGLL